MFKIFKDTVAGKLLSLLNKKQIYGMQIMFVLMLIGMALEMLGIGLVIPAIALMLKNDLTVDYPVFISVIEFLGNPPHEKLVVYGMFMLVITYTFKTLFLAYLTWWQARFVVGVQVDISQRLFSCYMRQAYTFHLQRNSAELIRNVTSEVGLLISGVLTPGLMLLTEFLVLVGILVLLLMVEPVGAILVFSVLTVISWLFFRVTRKYLVSWGEARQLHDGMRLQHLQQGLGGVKDAKLLGREQDFLDQYWLHSHKGAKITEHLAVLQALPRLWLELLAVVGLAGLVVVMLGQENTVESILPTMGVFAAAAFRLMPSVNRMLRALQSVRYSLPVINTLNNEFHNYEQYNKKSQSHAHILYRNELKLESVGFRYEAANKKSLMNINILVKKGTSVGIIGKSGSGKSTLIDVLLGLLKPENGQVLIDGCDIQSHLRDWQDQIGYVPQSIYLTDDTLRRNIAFGIPADKIDDESVMNAVKSAQLDDFIETLPNGLDEDVGERGIRLSGGQRQRIGIARALYHNPSVLVLDEATSSLDAETEKSVMDAVRGLQGKKTIIIVAHRLTTVQHCDYIYRLEAGNVVEEGDAKSVLSLNNEITNTLKM